MALMKGTEMTRKIMIVLRENEVAPRFDLTAEVYIAVLDADGAIEHDKTMVLAHSSADDLCQLILSEGVDMLVCNGIEQEFFEYLTWKKVHVLDSVMGPWERALEKVRNNELQSGSILFDRPER